MYKPHRSPVVKPISLLLALILLVSLTACGGREEPSVSEPEPSVSQSVPSFSNPISQPDEPEFIPEELPDNLNRIAELKAINEDVVGWLQVPGTTVDDVVAWYPNDPKPNDYYLRRDIYLRSSQAGTYFADMRTNFDGSSEGLSRNTTIYGHALDMNDNPDAPYFSQLKKFLEPEFAEDHPYIFFSTENEDLVWEIFAVFYATVNFDYITPDLSNEEFSNLISEVTKRSQYIYDVDVSTSDKILTLSTCVYHFTPGVYPNDYRYVVMARLMDPSEPYKEKAAMEVNPSPKEP